MTKTKQPGVRHFNPDNPLAQYLDAIRAEDEPRWLYERQRLRAAMGISRAYFHRMVTGHGMSLNAALQLHALTGGAVSPEGMCPEVPWEALRAYIRRS